MRIKADFIKDGRKRLVLLNMDEDMAISLIHSLAGQLGTRSANLERKEYTTEKGEYFTAVVDEFRPLEEDVNTKATEQFNRWVTPYIKKGGMWEGDPMHRKTRSTPVNRKGKKEGKK